MEFHNINRILVIKLRHIGDVLLTVPVFRALKETFPSARTTALVNAGSEDVLKGSAYIDEILAFDRSIKLLPALPKYKREADFLLQVRKNAFDMTIDLTGGDRPALISYLSGARYRLGWKSDKGFIGKKYLYTHRSEPDGSRHMVLQNMDAVRPYGINTEDLSIDFSISDNDRRHIRKILGIESRKNKRPVIHVHATSRWLFKCWNDRSMAEIIRWLLGKGFIVAVTSSSEPYELGKTRGILSMVGLHAGLVDLSGATTIKQLAAISEIADLFFGVDSAPMHIAASVGTPVVALFGPSGAFNWGPWDNVESKKLKGSFTGPYSARNGIQEFGIHTVIQEGRQCVPCGSDGCNGSKISDCLEDIKPADVKDILSEQLKALGSKSG